jgi:hypothetical protein
MHRLIPNRPHLQPSAAPTRTPASAAFPQGPAAGRGAEAAGNPGPAAPAPSRGGELDRPLGELPGGTGTDVAARRPGFTASTMRKLRATETHLTQALAERGRTPLLNSMHDEAVLDRPLLVHRFGLDRLFPLPGRQKEMKAILETYNAKFPGMEARLFSSMQKAMRTATRTLQPGQTLRGLATQNAYHAVAVEFRCHADNRISMIVLDGMRTQPEQLAALSEALGKNRHNRGGRIESAVVCGLDVQKDYSSCAAYSKDFLKEFHRRGADFQAFHASARALPAAARESRLPPGVSHVPGDAPLYTIASEMTQHHLPLSLFKNPQSADRLAQILNSRPSADFERINSKGETIPERLERMTGREWVSWHDRSARFMKRNVPLGDKAVPMAENYRRMYGKAAEYGETGIVRRPGDAGTRDATYEF